jgi:hypothetical protein
MQDIIAALVQLVSADATVAGLVEKVYGNEIPVGAAEGDLGNNVVVRYAPGTSLMSQSTMEHDTQNIDVLCYGKNSGEANRVYRAVFPVLRSIQRDVVGNTLIHWANPVGGAISQREPDVAWPAVVQTFQVFFAHRAVSP